MVTDVDALWRKANQLQLRIGTTIDDRPYGLRDFVIVDPAGFGLRFAQVVGQCSAQRLHIRCQCLHAPGIPRGRHGSAVRHMDSQGHGPPAHGFSHPGRCILVRKLFRVAPLIDDQHAAQRGRPRQRHFHYEYGRAPASVGA